MDSEIKKPLIRQAGSAVNLCRFSRHWRRTISLYPWVISIVNYR